VIALTVALAILIGVTLGLLGGGGSILAVPLLVYVAGMGAKESIATSLLVVGLTSIAALVGHARAGRVRWRTGLIFGGTAMAGAYLGGRLGTYLPGTWLLIGFAVMMLVTAAAMIRGRRGGTAPEQPDPQTGETSETSGTDEASGTSEASEASEAGGTPDLPIALVLAEGVTVGLVTGLVGAGGGFLVVPALVLLGGLPMPIAVGTSLLVIAMKSFAALAGYLSSVQIDWPLAAAVTTAAIAGSLVGARLVRFVPAQTLRRGFGWFVLAMGGFVLAQEMPPALLLPLGALVLLALLVGGGVVLARRGRAGKGGKASRDGRAADQVGLVETTWVDTPAR
jgi:hypothetical protein